MTGFISRTLSRLASADQEAGELKQDAEKAGCAPIATQNMRSQVAIHGVLRSVTLRPVGGVSALEAELYDGSARVTLIWLGRRKIEGIVPGRQLTAHGRMGIRNGERVLYNPRYELGA
ncbi:MAG: OB-fold nucleic acid binding domain-containing protein [Aeromicrobium sp.]